MLVTMRTLTSRSDTIIKTWNDCLETSDDILAAIECQTSHPRLQIYNDYEELRKAGYAVDKEQADDDVDWRTYHPADLQSIAEQL